MVLTPREAAQQVNDKLEEWWGRFVTPDRRRRRQQQNNMNGDVDDDEDNVFGNGHEEDEDDAANGGGRRRLSMLFQEAARYPPQLVARFIPQQLPALPQLPQLPQLELHKLIPSREQLGTYCAQVGAQLDRLPPLHIPKLPLQLPRLDQLIPRQLPQVPNLSCLQLPRLDQLPTRLPSKEDLEQLASTCWETMETTYDENKIVYQRRLTWGSVVLLYLLAMLLFSSQCCPTTTPSSMTMAATTASSSAVEVVYDPLQQQEQPKQKRRGKEARKKQQQDGEPVGKRTSWLSRLLSSFGKGRPRNNGPGDDEADNASSTSLVSSVVSTKVRDLDGACASTSLSAGRHNQNGNPNNSTKTENVMMHDDRFAPPPPLWFTFVRSNQANTARPTLPPIALRMVKDIDGYYTDDDFENRTVLPPPNSTSTNSKPIVSVSSSASSILKSMDVAGVNIAMEEEKEREKMEQKKHGILYPAAFTRQPVLRKQDFGFLHAWSRRVASEIPNMIERTLRVSWGGGGQAADDDDDSTLWWQERHSSRILHPGRHRTGYFSWWKSYSSSNNAAVAAKDPLQEIDGGHLLYSYYQVLLPQFIKDPSKVTFPRHRHANLCPENGCSTQVAIQHSLEFRESYQPWRPTAGMVKENEHGWIYARGLAKPTPGSAASSTKVGECNKNTTSSAKYAGQHAMIWARPGQHTIKDPQAYNRAILQTLEQGIAASLKHSHGQVGRFNIVIDASGFEWSKFPDLAVTKQLLHVLQDHYPRRLGAIFVFHLSPSAKVFLMFILKTFVDREVRQKIYLLSRNPVQRLAQLESVVDTKDIPDWIQGGQDSYQFDVNAYYTSPKTWRDDDFDEKETN